MRRKDAVRRDLQAAGRSPKEQLALLDKRLGKGVGATRERAKIAAALEIGNKKS